MSKESTKAQRKEIHAAAYRLGIDKDTVKGIIFNVSGQESTKKLSFIDASKVLDIIKGKNRSTGMATPQQIWKIGQLEKNLGWRDNPNRLKAFLKKYGGVESANWLTFIGASNAIESLKKLLKKESKE